MGFFRKKEKVHSLAEAMDIIRRNPEKDLIPVGNNGYIVVDASQSQLQINAEKEARKKNNEFMGRKEVFMKEITGNGEYRKMPHDISESHSSKPGRVVPTYNNYQSAQNYQKKYGQSR